MLLVHGESIGAPQIEREVASWDAQAFARLCNSVAWALTWRESQSLPAFTERVYVRDKGIDAEWWGDLGNAPMLPNSLLRSGTNVFQYKKREVAERARSAIVSKLCSELRGAIADVEGRTEKALASYVLFTNVDLTTEQREQIRQAIIADCGGREFHVDVVGAAILAAMLNDLSHLRSAFFATAAFRTWWESWEAHRSAAAFAEIPLIGRGPIMEQLVGWIADPEVRVIALTGTHMMGKTRVALEATRNWSGTRRVRRPHSGFVGVAFA